ncbi:hypothetical protein AYK26_05925 [Euryarchaeota archaeon SM23-78]|nr:MAG: hypothetical protein AYK26_05925 [Euryarchaeota archaeon SM23-78]
MSLSLAHTEEKCARQLTELVGEHYVNPTSQEESSQNSRQTLATDLLKGLRQNPASHPVRDALKSKGVMTLIWVGGKWKS